MNQFLDVIRRPVFAAADEGAAGGADDVKDPPADAGAGNADKTGKSALAAGAEAGADDLKGAATWPDDWRDKLADGDADSAKLLERYASPKDVAKALKEANNKIRSGKSKTDAPDAAAADAMKSWRKDNGIPDEATGYAIPEAIKEFVTDDDKPLLSSFTDYAHSKNLPQAAVDTALEWYFQSQDTILAERETADKTANEATTEALRQEYGREYRPNMQLAKDFMAATPEIGDQWSEARLPDGRRLGDIPEFVMHIVDQGRAKFGDTAFSNPDAESQHTSRKAEIEKIQRTDIDKYWDEGLDKEYQEIVARETKRRA